MKKLLVVCIAFVFINTVNAQTSWTDQPKKFNPYIGPSDRDLQLQAKSNAINNAVDLQHFKYYMSIAMQELNKQNYAGFISYSNAALSTGYSSPQVYYYRGIAFEQLGEKKDAKKSYKIAYKQGVYEAKEALKNLGRKK